MNFLHMTFFASIVSMLCFFVMLLAQNKFSHFKEFSLQDYLQSMLLGFLNPCLYYFVLFRAYSLLPAQIAQPLNYTWPIMLVLLSIPLLKQKIRFKNILAIITSYLGVFIILTRGDVAKFAFLNVAGILLALGSTIIWSLFWIFNIKDRRDEVVRLFLNFLFGVIFLSIILLIFTQPVFPDIKGLLGATYVGLFEMGITFVLWLKALRMSKTTAQVSNLIYIAPFLSLVLINFVVGEKILFTTIIGLIFIVCGIIIQRYND
jgi:drug/metabolite transporter (DMT)-like permease